MSKLIRACIAVAAFAAFAVLPAAASAQNDVTLVTHNTNVPVNVGTKIAGTSTQPTLLTNSAGETLVSCNKAHLHGEVTANSHTEVAGTITSTSFLECTGIGGAVTVTTNVGNGTPWCLRSSTAFPTHHFQVRGNSCAAASRSITFVLHTAIGQCAYERANGSPVTGTYTTNISTGGPDLHVEKEEFKRHNANFFCPAAGFIDFTIDLEETVGTTDLKLIDAT